MTIEYSTFFMTTRTQVAEGSCLVDWLLVADTDLLREKNIID
jgi:hypothetical protein